MKLAAIDIEISKIIKGTVAACTLFLGIFIILNILGIKALDLWLLAGLSIAHGARYIIFLSPSISSMLTNKANMWPGIILVFFQMISWLTFSAIFLIVTLLAKLNLYEINPILDVSVALFISVLILTLLLIFLKSKEKKQPTESML